MKSVQEVFREQIEAILGRANGVIIELSAIMSSPQSVERCSQIIMLVRSSREALEKGNIGAAMSVAQDAETEAMKLYADLLEPEEVLLDRAPQQIQSAPKIRQAPSTDSEASLPPSSPPMPSQDDPLALIASARSILFEIATDAEDGQVFQTCMKIRQRIKHAEDALSDSDGDRALSAAREAHELALRIRETPLGPSARQSRAEQLSEEILELRTTVWALGTNEETSLVAEDLRILIDQSKTLIEQLQIEEAERLLKKIHSTLDEQLDRNRKTPDSEEVNARIDLLDGISREWGVQVSHNVLKRLAAGVSTNDKNALAEILQSLISRSLLTAKPISEAMALEVLAEIKP